MLRQQWPSGSYFWGDLTNTYYKQRARTRRTSSQDWTQGNAKGRGPRETDAGGTTHRAFPMCRAQPEGWKPTTQHVTPYWTVSRAEVHEARWAARSHRSEGPERAWGSAPPHGRRLSRPNPWAHRTRSQQPFWQVRFSVEVPLAPHLLGKNSTDMKTDSSLMPKIPTDLLSSDSSGWTKSYLHFSTLHLWKKTYKPE